MINHLRFKNFKILKDSTLPLGPLTLLIGPNGSGKSTIFQALEAIANPGQMHQFAELISASERSNHSATIEVSAELGSPFPGVTAEHYWSITSRSDIIHHANYATRGGVEIIDDVRAEIERALRRIRVYMFNPEAIIAPMPLRPDVELERSGSGLVVVLDQLRDSSPERFEALNAELGRWMPAFDKILFSTMVSGARAISLRMRDGKFPILAQHLSDGTRIALAILALSYLPTLPPVIFIEEPDRGIHPRMLRDVRDALYRMSHPEAFDEPRPPVQVIVTTHSPYLLDLFKDHPEEIVIANPKRDNVRFERLSDMKNYEEIVKGSELGEVWYSGVLGGVPCRP